MVAQQNMVYDPDVRKKYTKEGEDAKNKKDNIPVKIADVEIGMYITSLDIPWSQTTFLFKGFRLEDEDDLNQLKEKCKWVIVTKSRSKAGIFPEEKPEPSKVEDKKTLKNITPMPQSRDNGNINNDSRYKKTDGSQRVGWFSALVNSLSGSVRSLTKKTKLQDNFNPDEVPTVQNPIARKENIERTTRAHNLMTQFGMHDKLKPGQLVPHQVSSTLSNEVEKAAVAKDSLVNTIEEALNIDINASSIHENVDVAQEAISGVVSSVIRNPDAMHLVNKIKRMDSFSYQHALDVSLMMIAFGRELCLNEEDLVQVGLGGLLHDVGEVKPSNKNSPQAKIKNITRFKIYRDHVKTGSDIAEKAGYSDIVKEIINNHHENYDGSGYPNGLSKNEIGIYGSMISIVDSYVSLTTGRCCDIPVTPNKAMDIMYKQKGKMFHPLLLGQFIQVIGIYPVGTMVQLSTGEIGFVYKQNKSRRLFPVVKVVMSKARTVLKSAVYIDLMQANASGENIVITSDLPADSFGLKVEDYMK